jgi:hypothetical protein
VAVVSKLVHKQRRGEKQYKDTGHMKWKAKQTAQENKHKINSKNINE